MKYLFRTITLMCFCGFLGTANAFSLPSQVDGVQVHLSGINAVKVSWQEAESEEDIIIGYRVYFGTTSVQETENTYDDEVVVYGGIETTVENLLPGATYYFAVTALDSEENESENYSLEARFIFPEEEKVVPDQEEEKESDLAGEQEVIKKVECAELPAKLTNCEVYECIFTHPITQKKLVRTISGIKNKMCFYKETISHDKRIECRFPREQWGLMGQYYQDIMSGKTTENLLKKAFQDKQCFILSGEDEVFPQDEKKEVLPENEGVKQEEKKFGPETPEQFKPAAPDRMAPVEAMNLTVDTASISSDGIVILSWEKSLNLDNDVADQVLYLRENLGAWDDGYSIGKNIETIEIDVESGRNYEFKITTVDAAGNLAESRVYSFSTKLTQSGPAGMFGVLLGIIILGIFGLFSSRRRA